jgi:hypothetical protein
VDSCFQIEFTRIGRGCASIWEESAFNFLHEVYPEISLLARLGKKNLKPAKSLEIRSKVIQFQPYFTVKSHGTSNWKFLLTILSKKILTTVLGRPKLPNA